MTQQQQTEYESQLHDLPPKELVGEYESLIAELAYSPTSNYRIELVRLARREIVRRLLS